MRDATKTMELAAALRIPNLTIDVIVVSQHRIGFVLVFFFFLGESQLIHESIFFNVTLKLANQNLVNYSDSWFF